MCGRRVVQQWGTVISIDVRSPAPPAPTVDAVLDDVVAWFARVDDLFSTWRPDTEISRIARQELAVEDASPEVQTVLALCDAVRVDTGGAFDITVAAHARHPRPGTGPLDPSGLVKGWALERAAERMVDAGVRRFCLNAGGDVAVRSPGDGAPPWRVGVAHPWVPGALAAVVEIGDGAVATSGTAERGAHVLDPRTGEAATGLVSVTVIGPDLALADAHATAAMALGDGGMPWLATRTDVDAMGITDDGRVLTTLGFDRWRAPAP